MNARKNGYSAKVIKQKKYFLFFGAHYIREKEQLRSACLGIISRSDQNMTLDDTHILIKVIGDIYTKVDHYEE